MYFLIYVVHFCSYIRCVLNKQVLRWRRKRCIRLWKCCRKRSIRCSKQRELHRYINSFA